MSYDNESSYQQNYMRQLVEWISQAACSGGSTGIRYCAALTGVHSSRPPPNKDAGALGKREKQETAKPCADPFLPFPCLPPLLHFPFPSLPLPFFTLPYLTLPFFTLPYLTFLSFSFPSLSLTLPYLSFFSLAWYGIFNGCF